jgi:hypothetical protein
MRTVMRRKTRLRMTRRMSIRGPRLLLSGGVLRNKREEEMTTRLDWFSGRDYVYMVASLHGTKGGMALH